MGDLPLRTPIHRRFGGPLPRQLPNGTHAYLSANLFNKYLHAEPLFYGVLVRLSPGYPPLIGKLHTRYSPVRRSPSISIATYHAAPRLACVKPVASVHPEPGSNSSLLKLFVLISALRIPLFIVVPLLTVYSYLYSKYVSCTTC